eukprot:TRINITY_DN105762_c0_g1_i1.p1 TRINITY_DN105762_c0_g1~~TRINITY_DN105762_c0_g1_i1.p1  ORF type:complete len:227 (-),score=46.56 TRINITY_DN105762_c0_g1_i1:115-795(-)
MVSESAVSWCCARRTRCRNSHHARDRLALRAAAACCLFLLLRNSRPAETCLAAGLIASDSARAKMFAPTCSRSSGCLQNSKQPLLTITAASAPSATLAGVPALPRLPPVVQRFARRKKKAAPAESTATGEGGDEMSEERRKEMAAIAERGDLREMLTAVGVPSWVFDWGFIALEVLFFVGEVVIVIFGAKQLPPEWFAWLPQEVKSLLEMGLTAEVAPGSEVAAGG